MTHAYTIDADVVVIGAGVMGASIAYQLTRKSDKRVVLVDQSAPLRGMSGRTFGQVRLHYSNTLMLQMAQRGYAYFQDWQRLVGYGDAGYVPLGYMLIVVKAQLEALHRNIALAQDLGIETRFIDPDEIKRLEPCIEVTGLEGGAFDPQGGYIDVARIVLSWLSAGQEAGVQVLSGQRVTGINTQGGRTHGVRTDQGVINASHVVCATGSWGPELLKPLGIDLPLVPRRIDTMYLRQQPGRPQIQSCITDGNSNVAIRPDMGRDFLVGAYAPGLPDASTPDASGDADTDAAHLQRIQASLAERLPAFADATPVRSVNGSYDITPDWHPLIGWVGDIENLFVATGFSGHGLKLAPAVGEVVADMVLGKVPEFDISPLRLERFVEGSPMFLAYGPGARA